MYSITFEMNIDSLELNDDDPYNNTYGEIYKVLQKPGLT